MPTVPNLPPEMQQQNPAAQPTSPSNYLMAAADLKSSGNFQSAPVPTGKAFQTGKSFTGRGKSSMQVVK